MNLSFLYLLTTFRCLERNAENRPIIVEIMLHPFINSIEDSPGEEVNMEEKLSEDYVPELGDKAKEVTEMQHYLQYFSVFIKICFFKR